MMEGFGKFLNSINHPIQILCDSKKINPVDWTLKCNDVDYALFLKKIIEEKNTSEKKFYICFHSKTKEELTIRKQNIEKGIKRCGLSFEDVDFNYPNEFPNIGPNWFYLDGHYYQTLYVDNWPHAVTDGWLSDLYHFDKNMSISMFIHPVENNQALSFITKKMVRLESSAIIKENEDCYYGDFDEEISTAINMRDEIMKNEGKFFFVNFYVTVKSKDLEQLKSDVKSIQSLMMGMMISSKKSFLRQDDGFKCSLPHGIDYLKDSFMYTFTTTPLKRFFPFLSTNIVDSGGILIGENLLNKSLIFLNHFNYLTSSMVVLGKSGSGKSYSVKSQVIKLAKNNVEVTVLDIEGEFGRLQGNENLIVKKLRTIKEYREFIVEYWKNVTEKRRNDLLTNSDKFKDVKLIIKGSLPCQMD
jgi:hypothetical protein